MTLSDKIGWTRLRNYIAILDYTDYSRNENLKKEANGVEVRIFRRRLYGMNLWKEQFN